VHIEQPSLYEHLTAREHLEILCLLRSLDFDHISEILQYVELSQAADQRVKTFSLGMKQRLALASPLLGEPELLILDEPTNGLDPRGKRWMRDCIRDLPQRFETTVLLSSHHIHDIQAIVDDVGILHEGTLQLQGSKESLLQKFPDLSSVEDVFFELTTHSHRGRKV
jgi:ABC-2 type transport system ATP-binding protein